MGAPKTPTIIHPVGDRNQSLKRMKFEADNAETNMKTFMNRGDTKISHYYAGIRDGLLRAIQILEHE